MPKDNWDANPRFANYSNEKGEIIANKAERVPLLAENFRFIPTNRGKVSQPNQCADTVVGSLVEAAVSTVSDNGAGRVAGLIANKLVNRSVSFVERVAQPRNTKISRDDYEEIPDTPAARSIS